MAVSYLNSCPLCGKKKETGKAFCDKCESSNSDTKRIFVEIVGVSVNKGLLAHYSNPRTIRRLGSYC